MPRAQGTFDVQLTPVPHSGTGGDAPLGQVSVAKRFHGPLDASSEGRMLTASTEVEGSAGYVAIERVVGTLDGRAGSFVLQHHGLMDRGSPELSVVVVPDSGTGELKHLAGKMTIRIESGVHSYVFDYVLAEPRPAHRS